MGSLEAGPIAGILDTPVISVSSRMGALEWGKGAEPVFSGRNLRSDHSAGFCFKVAFDRNQRET